MMANLVDANDTDTLSPFIWIGKNEEADTMLSLQNISFLVWIQQNSFLTLCVSFYVQMKSFFLREKSNGWFIITFQWQKIIDRKLLIPIFLTQNIQIILSINHMHVT